MKNFLFLITVISCACILSCKLEEPPRPVAPVTAADSHSAIQGTLKYRNVFSMDTSRAVVLPGTTISIFGENDLTQPLSTTVSDSSGRFRFDGLFPDSTYRITARGTVNTGGEQSLVFSGEKLSGGADSLVELILLVDEQEQHGFYISTVDVDGALISKARVLIYGSKIIADADSTNSGTNAIVNTDADIFGNVLVTGLPVGKVYLKSAIMLNDSLSLSSDTQLLNVADDKIKRVKVVLQ